jgi:hypothetical protein
MPKQTGRADRLSCWRNWGSRLSRVGLVAAGIAALGSTAHAQARPPRLDSARFAAAIALTERMQKQLHFGGFGIAERKSSAGIYFENWTRTPLSRAALLPVARRTLQALVDSDSAAGKADTLSARFSDYEPRCATFIWIRKPVAAPPDSFAITGREVICRHP